MSAGSASKYIKTMYEVLLKVTKIMCPTIMVFISQLVKLYHWKSSQYIEREGLVRYL